MFRCLIVKFSVTNFEDLILAQQLNGLPRNFRNKFVLSQLAS